MQSDRAQGPKALVRQGGFTAIELMVSMTVFAILLVAALYNFAPQIHKGRAEAASDGLFRAVANARAVASQTGKRTVLTFDQAVSGCGSHAAWAITQPGTTAPVLLNCVTKSDFDSRYAGTTYAIAGGTGDGLSVEYLPTGIGRNTDKYTVVFTSGAKTINVVIHAGGVAEIVS